MKDLTDFEKRVMFCVSKIPYGRVTTYGTIAKKCGIGSAARLVGTLLGKWANTYPLPFHRVVNRQGLLTGKNAFGGENNMKNLLEAEGISVENDQVDLGIYYYSFEEIENIDQSLKMDFLNDYI